VGKTSVTQLGRAGLDLAGAAHGSVKSYNNHIGVPLTLARMPPGFVAANLAVVDCSFISLRQILPAAVALLRKPAKLVALIKPQFEAGKAEADKGAGVISDPAVHARVLAEIEGFVATLPGLRWRGVTESPLLGPAGNKEFLALLEKVD